MNREIAFYGGGALVSICATIALAVFALPRTPEPAPRVFISLTDEQHQMLVEIHCYSQGGEWGPIHGCTLLER